MIETNKDSLLKLAVMGKISHPVESRFVTTWDGKPKLTLGRGGINYNVKIGDSCFGWASGEKVVPGVSAEDLDTDRPRGAFINLSCIGNEAKLMSGTAKGATGTVIGKIDPYVIIHFKEEDLEKLSLGDMIKVKAWGLGLEIKDVEGVKVLSSSPDFIESMGLKVSGSQLIVPVVKVIPHALVGQGAGGTPSERSNWDIQTNIPAAAEEKGLEKLRLGDIVALGDILSFWGMGHQTGAWTIGVITGGASDLAGQGISVLPILTSYGDEIKPEIESKANIAYYLGLREI
ncbi:MAG: DUF4438 domain-containing protein [Candidatus Bathyarchaeia archaeon]